MLNKDRLANKIHSAIRNMEPDGSDYSWSFANAVAQAIVDEIKEGDVNVTVTSGGCTYSGVHPPVASKGKVS